MQLKASLFTVLSSSVILSSLVWPSIAQPCTSFELSSAPQTTVAYSFDWYDEFGHLITNLKGQRKTALEFKDLGRPLSWVSKYGSVTFNQVGAEFPQVGMNETGLSVQSSRTDIDGFAKAVDDRLYINERQLLQYILDSAATLDEVVSLVSTLRLHRIYTPNHLFVCDAERRCGAIEYENGAVSITMGAALKVPVLTNYRFALSAKDLGKPIPEDPAVDTRFMRVAKMIEEFGRSSFENPIDFAFQVLEKVPYPGGMLPSRWLIVHEPKTRTIHFRTSQNGQIRRVDLRKLDFSSTAARKLLDLQSGEGDITGSFKLYDQRLVDANTDRTRFLNQPWQDKDLAARIKAFRTSPMSCTEKHLKR